MSKEAEKTKRELAKNFNVTNFSVINSPQGKRLPLETASVDKVVSIQGGTLLGSKQIPSLFSEINRVLKPSARAQFVFTITTEPKSQAHGLVRSIQQNGFVLLDAIVIVRQTKREIQLFSVRPANIIERHGGI